MKQYLQISKSLKTNKLLFCFILFHLNYTAQTNRGILLFLGANVNKTFCNTILIDNTYNVTNASQGNISYSYDFGTKFKSSKHFSFELGYQKLKQHIVSNFTNLEVLYSDNITHTGYHYAGTISYTDNLYLSGNHFYLGINYELTKEKNNLVFGLSLSRVDYNTKKSYLTRNYTDLSTTMYLPNIEPYYRSSIHAPKLLGLNISLKYERMIYKNVLGFFSKFTYHYNFNFKYFEYTLDDMGFNKQDEYLITNENGQKYYNDNYFSLKFNSMLFNAGLFYKFNFKEHEKNSN